MGVKNWIDRDGQNARINHEIKDWQLVTARLFGVRNNGGNPGFDGDLAPEQPLGTIKLRIDQWRGSSDADLDLVGKVDVIDIRKSDKIKFIDRESGHEIETVVNDVAIFGNTLQLGLKYA